MIKPLITMMVVALLTGPVLTVKAQAPMTTEDYATVCEMSVEEFELLSSVVEAESNRSTDGDLRGRILICATIINRVNDDRFPSTITDVLTQRGQFTTVRNGHSVTQRTEYSDEAVLQAIQMLENEEIPDNILFFNCRGYNYGTPYDYVGGNYFMIME